MSFARAFVRGCIRSRLGWLLVCLHAAWFMLAVANMSPPAPEFAKYLDNEGWSSAALLAGRPFHFAYESVSLKVVFLTDLPAMLAAAVVGLVLSPVLRAFHVGHFVGSYIGAVLTLLAASCQWLAIGQLIETRLKSFPWGASALLRLNRYFLVIFMSILLLTVIAVPIINKRSQAQGFRHGTISFQ